MLGAPKATATGAMQVSAVETPAAGTSRPVRRAMQLLLERPTLAESVEHVELLAQAGAHGIEVLIEAIDYFHARPDARAAPLVEAWTDTPKGSGVARQIGRASGRERVCQYV